MSQAMKPTKAKVKGYGLIIDKDGMPCILNPLSVPDLVWAGLSKEQKTHANNNVENSLRRYN